jgi:hypothetical protein
VILPNPGCLDKVIDNEEKKNLELLPGAKKRSKNLINLDITDYYKETTGPLKFFRSVQLGPKSGKRFYGNLDGLGLAYLGFMDRCSAVLVSASVQASLLCPSFEIANRTLSSFGIDMDIKTIRRLCMHMGNRAMENRHRVTLSENAIPFGVNS